MLLSAATDGAPDAMLAFDMRSDGSGWCHLNAPIQSSSAGKPAGDSDVRSSTTAFNNIHMNGQEVFRFAVRAVPETLKKALTTAGLTGEDIDWLVMHQANQRILDSVAKKLRIAPEKVCHVVLRLQAALAVLLPGAGRRVMGLEHPFIAAKLPRCPEKPACPHCGLEVRRLTE